MSSPLLSPSPSRTSVLSTATFQAVHLNALQPRITPSPSSLCPPNTLVVQLSTTLVIPDYSLFFPEPIQSYTPTYAALQDGSLLTPPFQQDMADSNLSLLVIGALAMLFFRNILVSGDYLRRGKVKKKSLFYLLFLSQLLAPAGLLPIILSYFNRRISCTAVLISSCVSGATSLGILITGILGVKAYRCLKNPRFLAIILGLFQAASTTVVVIDATLIRGVRRLTGSCTRNNDLRFIRYFVTIQFLESLFICGCFLYVCWKSRNSPAVRGRVSLQLSMDNLPIEFPEDRNGQNQTTRRGWWDYVPENKVSGNDVKANPDQRASAVSKKRNPGRRSNSTNTQSSKQSRPRNNMNPSGKLQGARRVSLAPSTISRLSRLFPRMELFQEVMKDELFYTTFITSSCVIVAVLAVIGVNFKNGLSVVGWIALNWGIISFLTIHSFGRVVRRHERESLLSHPTTCTAIAQAANIIVERKNLTTRRDALSLDSEKIMNADGPDDPFSDRFAPHRVNPFEQSSADDASSIIHPTSPSWRRVRLSYLQESLPASPDSQDFPTSNPATPTVPIDPNRTPGRNAFSGSIFFSTGSSTSTNVTREEGEVWRGNIKDSYS